MLSPRSSAYRKVHPRAQDSHSLRTFQRVVRDHVKKEQAAPEARRDVDPTTVEFFNDLYRLRPMMKEESMETCFEFFMTKLWTKARTERKSRLLKQRGTYLLIRVAKAKLANIDNEKLPSVSQITQLFHEMDTLSPSKWSGLIMGLIQTIIASSTARKDFSDYKDYGKALARKQALLDDLIESWIIFYRYQLSAKDYHDSDIQSSEEAEFRIPRLNEARLRRFASREDLAGAIAMVFPYVPGMDRAVSAVALATFVLLVDPAHSTVNARRKAKPLLEPIARVLTVVVVDQSALSTLLEPYPEVLLYVLKLWHTITSRLRRVKGTGELQEYRRMAGVMQGGLGRKRDSNTNNVQEQMADALNAGNVAALEAVWAQFWVGDSDVGLKDRMRHHHATLFDYFIMAFTALRRPQRAIEVWDAMVSINIQPTLKTWTGMLEGCRRSKNPIGLNNVWRKLLAAGVPLDTKVWSLRIVGLMDCGEPEAGVRALTEMLAMSKLPGGAPLTIECINAALAGLIRLNATAAAKKVLSWASENGLEPDIVTYNTLLQPMVYQGNIQAVDGLLKMMREHKVEPDAATFTIMLDGLITNTKDAPPAQQRESVERLLAEMEAVNIKANMETFARIIHLLTRDGKYAYHHTEGAIGAVYDHILSKGLRPSTHIYTMLITHYFSCKPPAVAEVDKLLRTPGLRLDGGGLDRVFWERVIKGYALAGHLDRAFELFQKGGDVATAMTLGGLETLLRCLISAGRTAEAQNVVDTVRSYQLAQARTWAPKAGQTPRAAADIDDFMSRSSSVPDERDLEGATRKFWKHGFWVLAHSSGLLTREQWSEISAGGTGAER